jgi:hypothetical protein
VGLPAGVVVIVTPGGGFVGVVVVFVFVTTGGLAVEGLVPGRAPAVGLTATGVVGVGGVLTTTSAVDARGATGGVVTAVGVVGAVIVAGPAATGTGVGSLLLRNLVTPKTPMPPTSNIATATAAIVPMDVPRACGVEAVNCDDVTLLGGPYAGFGGVL